MIYLLLLASLQAQDTTFFETKVRPVLARQCYSCHGAEKQFSGLRVDSREALLKGGNRGPALTPGNRDSLLLKRSDGALIRLTTRISDAAGIPDAEARLTGFARVLAPVLGDYVPGRDAVLRQPLLNNP